MSLRAVALGMRMRTDSGLPDHLLPTGQDALETREAALQNWLRSHTGRA